MRGFVRVLQGFCKGMRVSEGFCRVLHGIYSALEGQGAARRKGLAKNDLKLQAPTLNPKT